MTASRKLPKGWTQDYDFRWSRQMGPFVLTLRETVGSPSKWNADLDHPANRYGQDVVAVVLDNYESSDRYADEFDVARVAEAAAKQIIRGWAK